MLGVSHGWRRAPRNRTHRKSPVLSQSTTSSCTGRGISVPCPGALPIRHRRIILRLNIAQVSADERLAYLAKAKTLLAHSGPTQFSALAQPTIVSLFTAAEAGPSSSSALQQDYLPSAYFFCILPSFCLPFLQRKCRQKIQKVSKGKGKASPAASIMSGHNSSSESEDGTRPPTQRKVGRKRVGAGEGKSPKGAGKGERGIWHH